MATICNSYADANARGSQAAPALRTQCQIARQTEVSQGIYNPDNLGPGADYQELVYQRGLAMIQASPAAAQAQQAQILAPMSPSRQRGNIMAQGVRAASPPYNQGVVAPTFVSWYQSALKSDSEMAAGFNDALQLHVVAPGVVKATNPTAAAASTSSIPQPVLIGAGVVGVLGIAALVYKLTR